MRIIALEVGPFFSNCYVVGQDHSNEGIVIDAGAEPGEIMVAIKKMRLMVRYIIATHGHMDHVGAVSELKKATGALFAIHESDAVYLSRRGFLFGGIGGAVQPDILLHGGETISAGSLSFRVLHTPGHSPGGICLVGEGVVFTGDTLFRGSIGRYDFPGASGRQLLDSIRTELLSLPDDTVVYPGHGPMTTIGEERKNNPFLADDQWV
ncbi:MAG: MBL fold metallo-hydrolase [Dehalococcoidia bacterium]|nr:MBL fold metallo-hydrolase [Dehalococcoidia bacterium]